MNSYEPIKLNKLLKGSTEIKWVVEPLIPPVSTVLLAGRSGVGKTWLSLDLALSITTGAPWLGQFPVQRGPVLVVDEENSELLLRTRAFKLLKARGIDPELDLPLYFLVGVMTNLSPPPYKGEYTESYTQLLQSIQNIKPVLVIFDSLTRCHRSNENSANEMASVFANARRIVDATGVSCFFNHHFRKAGGGSTRSGDRIRGSTDIRAFCDATLLVDGKDDGCIVTHDKTRWSEPILPFRVGFHYTESTFALRYSGEISQTESKVEVAWAWVQDMLDGGPLSRKQLANEIDGKFSLRTLDDVLKWRWENGFLDKRQEGRVVVYSVLD